MYTQFSKLFILKTAISINMENIDDISDSRDDEGEVDSEVKELQERYSLDKDADEAYAMLYAI